METITITCADFARDLAQGVDAVGFAWSFVGGITAGVVFFIASVALERFSR